MSLVLFDDAGPNPKCLDTGRLLEIGDAGPRWCEYDASLLTVERGRGGAHVVEIVPAVVAADHYLRCCRAGRIRFHNVVAVEPRASDG